MAFCKEENTIDEAFAIYDSLPEHANSKRLEREKFEVSFFLISNYFHCERYDDALKLYNCLPDPMTNNRSQGYKARIANWLISEFCIIGNIPMAESVYKSMECLGESSDLNRARATATLSLVGAYTHLQKAEEAIQLLKSIPGIYDPNKLSKAVNEAVWELSQLLRDTHKEELLVGLKDFVTANLRK
jgi:tetratricopeptide (TPR) repeat protein